MQIHKFWRRLTTTRYARALEAKLAQERAVIIQQGIEIARLRAENRALLNSILGIAGVPPLTSQTRTPRLTVAQALLPVRLCHTAILPISAPASHRTT
jgi:hypothetical protein